MDGGASIERGKKIRETIPRSSHADWTPAPERPDPVSLLEQQATTRVPDLVPIRYGRMAVSPFTYFRGAALPMAADLATTPRIPLDVQLCGDAHLSNFGGFASPDRDLVFDLNDFDETAPGPFDWDVKRLAASIEIAGRSLNLSINARRAAVAEATAGYRLAMRDFATMTNLDVWYTRLDLDTMAARYGEEGGKGPVKALLRTARKARSKDRLKAARKLTEVVDGDLRFVSDPPTLVPIEELIAQAEAHRLEVAIEAALQSYRDSLPVDLRHLLDGYEYLHTARKVVGVGSVGTRAWIALFTGRDHGDPLLIQIKEAQQSVLEPYLGASVFPNHGQRVVEGQRLMQATGDILLGFARTTGVDGGEHDYYMRQLWDWKASADIDAMDAKRLKIYARVCGWTLARAHARSGDRIAIAAYLGGGDAFDRAIIEFAHRYADQNELDHRALLAAIEQGRITALAEA